MPRTSADSNVVVAVVACSSLQPIARKTFFVKEYIATARRYDYEGIEKVLLLLHQYNLRSIGVHDAGTSDAGLLKELAVKMIS